MSALRSIVVVGEPAGSPRCSCGHPAREHASFHTTESPRCRGIVLRGFTTRLEVYEGHLDVGCPTNPGERLAESASASLRVDGLRSDRCACNRDEESVRKGGS